MSKLTANRVREIVKECLFKDEEAEAAQETGEFIKAEGAVMTIGFHPERLAKHKGEIGELLTELPDEFKKSSGGGMSFLNACVDRDGVQWGEHRDIDNLLVLGLATGLVSYCMPREMWDAFPGGMPYFVFDDTPAKAPSV